MSYDLWAGLNDWLVEVPTDHFTQEDLELWLELTRRMSWDIPSALPCDHTLLDEDGNIFDTGYVMHRDDPGFDTILVPHFKEVHHLDLTSDKINWSFDT